MFGTITDRDKLAAAKTVYGEARGEILIGQLAVFWVILNRYKKALDNGGNYWWGNTIESICLRREQFSCWNPSDPNRTKLLVITLTDPTLLKIYNSLDSVLDGSVPDPTEGADTYKVTKLPWPAAWGNQEKEPTAIIGNHSFYKLY